MQIGPEVSAIVVGGASGMGAATVHVLTARRARVALLDLDATLGSEVAARTGARFFEADVTDEDSVVRAFAAARDALGQERILVATPGGGGLGYTAWRDASTAQARRHDLARYRRIVELNLTGTFLCASVAAAGMIDLAPAPCGDRGVILMTSSVASQDGPAATVAYVAAKAGINGMTLAMARDLAPHAIRVNTLLPGNFDTPLVSGLPGDYKASMQSWNLHPKRFGRPEEYAALALHVIENPYLNAALLRLDGGSRT